MSATNRAAKRAMCRFPQHILSDPRLLSSCRRRMAERIVDELEAVEIEEQDAIVLR